MVKSPHQTLPFEEFLKLPETKPAREYIDGEIVQKPMPQGKHSRIQGALLTKINLMAENQRIAYAFPELRCTFAGRSIVPDVVVLRWERIPRDEKGEIANIFADYPDWIIEILSPEQNLLQVTKKIIHCLKYGTVLGWLILPEDHSIFVYPQGQSPQFLEDKDDLLPVPNFLPQLQLTVGEVFSWLKL
jgi:Uma2 family endonuclease